MGKFLLRVTIKKQRANRDFSWDVIVSKRTSLKRSPFLIWLVTDDLIHALDGHNGLLCGVAVRQAELIILLGPAMMPVWRIA